MNRTEIGGRRALGLLMAAMGLLNLASIAAPSSPFGDPGRTMSGDISALEANLGEYKVAFAHLENDPGHKVESEARAELTRMDPRFGVRVIPIDLSLPANPSDAQVADARAAISKAGQPTVIGGTVHSTPGRTTVQYVVINASPGSLGGVYQPDYFRLPEVATGAAADAISLVVGMESVALIRHGSCDNRYLRLYWLIGSIQRLADLAEKDSRVSRDSRARMNFLAAVALDFWGTPEAYDKGNAYYLAALSDWLADNNLQGSAVTLFDMSAALGSQTITKASHDKVVSSLKSLAQAADLFAKLGDRRDEALAVGTASYISLNLAKFEGGTQRLIDARTNLTHRLDALHRDYDPRLWAFLHNLRGMVLDELGHQTANQELLNEALSEYQTAMTVYARKNDPYNWAVNRLDWSAGLIDLAELQAGTGGLEQAITQLREVLTIVEPCYPQASVSANADLGRALANVGLRTERMDYLQQSIGPMRKALGFAQFADATSEAITMESLAETLGALGDRQKSRDEVKDSLELQRKALDLLSRAQNPKEYALIESRQAHSLRGLGEWDSNHDLLAQAIATDRDALTAITRENDPADWRQIEVELATTLTISAQHEQGQQAIRDAQQSLAEWEKLQAALSGTSSQIDRTDVEFGRGEALDAWGEQEPGSEHLLQALDAYQKVLRTITPSDDLTQWKLTEDDLGVTLYAIGQRERGTDHLMQAAAAFRAELKLMSADEPSESRQEVQSKLNDSLAALKERGVSE